MWYLFWYNRFNKGVSHEIGVIMWKLSYTYKDFVGIKPKNKELYFKTIKELHNYIKVHPTIEVISYTCTSIEVNS